MPYQSFEDLDVWKRACRVAVRVYEVLRVCRDYGLRDQMTRSAVSIASNIAEGSERGSIPEYIRFLHIAKGSAAELRTQVYIAQRIGLLDSITQAELTQELKEISSMLQATARNLKLKTPMSDTLIKVDDLSKKFCRSLKRSLWYGLQDLGKELRGQRHGGNGELRPEEFWAVKDVNFELKRGECLGLIGHNGAGKTTLLRMLNGLIKPDQGRIEMRGQVGALIALGAGFNPILTGRENIYVNASVLGLSKRHVDAKLEEIIGFAEIDEFIDTPVRNYSSGMRVRLGFAVAAVLIEPDILFLDEVLAVGDIGFVIKCLNTVRRLTENAAVVFVSHNMQYISSFCTRVMVMEHGSTLLDTDNLSEGVDRYYSLIKHDVQISGTGEAQVLGFDLVVDGETRTEKELSINRGSAASALLRIHVSGPRTGVYVSVNVLDEAMTPIISTPIEESESKLLCVPPGEHQIRIPLWEIDLKGGNYSFVVVIKDVDTSISLARAQGLRPFRVLADGAYWGKVVRPVVAHIDSLPARRPEKFRVAGS